MDRKPSEPLYWAINSCLRKYSLTPANNSLSVGFVTWLVKKWKRWFPEDQVFPNPSKSLTLTVSKWENPDCWSIVRNYLFLLLQGFVWGFHKNGMKPTLQKSKQTIMTSSEVHQWLWTITRGIGGTENCGGKNSMRIVKIKKNLFHNQVHTDNPSKKKTTLGPRQQDRLKVITNKYSFSCHYVHHLNSGRG